MALPTYPQARWPQDQDALYARARELAGQGCGQDRIRAVLTREFPGLPSENYYQNPAAIAVMERVKGRLPGLRAPTPLRPVASASGPGPAPAATMTAGVIAFAEARGLLCAYCGRAGKRESDPDGFAWCRDAVPAGFQVAGRDLELACSACKADGGRFARLGSQDDIV